MSSSIVFHPTSPTPQAPAREVTVLPQHRVVEYVDGEPTRVLGPGRHRVPRSVRRRATHRRVEVLEQVTTLAPQELLTVDGVQLRVTVAVRHAVADPVRYLERAADPVGVVYLAVQLALREGLADLEAEAVLRRRPAGLGEALVVAAREAGEPVGLEVRAVVVKDVLLPAELRAAYAEVATTRARGQAQLEAARAETAALRSLANGARLLDDHPALARLRLVQALPPGARVEIVAPEGRAGRPRGLS